MQWRRRVPVKKTHDYIHHYRGYWSDGGKCIIRVYREKRRALVVICSHANPCSTSSLTWRRASRWRPKNSPEAAKGHPQH